MADDAKLAARLSCIFQCRGHYLAVMDGPRMSRPDGRGEAVRRNNALAKAAVTKVVLADLSEDQLDAMNALLPDDVSKQMSSDDLDAMMRQGPQPSILRWGRDNIGVGLLIALRNGKLLEFDDFSETKSASVEGRQHLVVCEEGNPLSEVIAANYAFALEADLVIIPQVAKTIAEEVTEELYSLYDLHGQSATDRLAQLSSRIRSLCPFVVPPEDGAITFFTSHIPYGFGYPEVPSSHLEVYPDLGVSVLNGFASGNAASGIRCAVLIDPGETQASEVDVVARSLAKKSVFVRVYPWVTSNVRDVTNIVELFPYDFLLFATHCGDADGYRFTYEFQDASGRPRRLVVDTAIGIARTDDPDMLNVMHFERFHDLDGVSWNDPNKTHKIEVGTAILDFVNLSRAGRLEPVDRELIPRVLGSAALKMADDNYIAIPRELADHGSPVIFNNACASWHQLSGRFMFAGARAYIGTLFPVTSTEAVQAAEAFVEHDDGTPLAKALWLAQERTYGQSQVRRPYVMTGIYPQNLHVVHDDVPSYLKDRLRNAENTWQSNVPQSPSEERAVSEILKYYQSEIERFERNWGAQAQKKGRKPKTKGKKRLFRV